MGLILLDGFEDFSSWNPSGAGALPAGGTIVAARTGNGLQLTQQGGNAGQLYRFLPALETDTVTVGFALRITTLSASGIGALISLMSDNGLTTHMVLRVTNTFAIAVLRSSTVLATTIPNLLALNAWYYIEFQSKLSDTVGTYVVKVNGVTVLSATAQDTKNAGTKVVFDSVVINGDTGTTCQLDDLYVESGAADPFLGDIVIETLYPNGNGTVNAWTNEAGNSTANWSHVDEVPPATSDYVFSATSAQQDLYALTDLVHTSGTIVGVCHTAYAARTDAVTPRQIRLVNRRTTDSKSAAIDMATVYAGYAFALANDPETSAAWTIANVNALQSGVELV